MLRAHSRRRRRRLVESGTLLLLTTVCLGLVPVGASASVDTEVCSDYSCPEYLEHDLDNYTRARGRQISEPTSPEYSQEFLSACADTSSRAAAQQAGDVQDGRFYGGVGQQTCWWSVGDAPTYNSVKPRRIHFQSRTGAKLQAHLWGTKSSGTRPGVVITTGSIQASEQMYWWAADALARRGYQVLTFDVQGQGQSETTGHEPGSLAPTFEGVPSQQAPNFHDGTVDALRFFLSTPKDPYVPGTWSDKDLKAAKDAGDAGEFQWFNPAWKTFDHDRLGIIGHSLGAGAVSAVQQCSDESDLWKKLELCTGRSFPIRAVLAWDALSSADVKPVVPAMSQQADGYFLFPTLSPQPPDPNSSMGGYRLWKRAGVEVFMYVVRGGTHIEWSVVPYTSATNYGMAMNTYYTLAWMDRWVPKSPSLRGAAFDALVSGPKSAPGKPWSANYFSTRRYSAMALRQPEARAGSWSIETTDVRKWAGRSAVGDWAGSNEDRRGRILP